MHFVEIGKLKSIYCMALCTSKYVEAVYLKQICLFPSNPKYMYLSGLKIEIKKNRCML